MSKNNTTKLWYEETGMGVPFIFLHGYPLDHTIWNPIIKRLKDELRVVTPDLRGFGRSPVVTQPYSLSDMADDVARLMDDALIDKAVLVGHSMGGYISFAFARYHADRLLGLGLVATHHLADSPESSLSRKAQVEMVRQTGSVASVAQEMPYRVTSNAMLHEALKTIMQNIHPSGVAGALEAMITREDASEVLAGFTLPAAVIAGVNDRLVPLERTRQMASYLKAGVLYEIPGAEHMPMLEEPNAVSLCLLALRDRVIKAD